MINQAKLRSFCTAKRYIDGFEISKAYKDAVRLDKLNANTKWQDATKAEMNQLAEYKIFYGHGTGSTHTKGIPKDLRSPCLCMQT